VATLTGMRIYRFDEEVSLPVSDAGSRHRLGSLVAPAALAGIDVVHLPAGGSIGRQRAAELQLLAVVSGSGWVSGGDAHRRDLRTGYAALWEAGEEQEAGSDAGLMAIRVEGSFEVRALSVMRAIEVRDYDSAWPDWFERLRARVWPAVEDVALRIDHVGSTSVPGLAAKPIIDIDIVVASQDDVRPVIDRLAGAGYRWRGDLGVEGREAFEPVRDEDLPEHHLYLVVEDNRAHVDHWLLRDVLRSDAGARERYAALKRRNVELAAGDIDFYVAAKAALVAELLTRARAERGLPPVEYWEPDLP
jgi:GrpB-like predicted nucleotidyltransferase (UPF0157 family)